MRRSIAVVLMLCAFLPLSGCTLSVYNNYRELERLQVIETVGFDAAQDGGVVLSISAGRDASGREPVRALKQLKIIGRKDDEKSSFLCYNC